MSFQLSVSHLAYPVSSLGPGNRIALWVAGCPMRCKECITPHLQDKNQGKLIDSQKLLERILNLDEELLNSINGLTLSGGEPFVQAEGLAWLWEKLKSQFPEWNLLVFSGYQLKQLQADSKAQPLLKQLDILIDGPYLPELEASSERHPLIASPNQQIYYLSANAKKRAKAFQLEFEKTQGIVANIGLGKTHNWLIGIIDKQQRIDYHNLINP